MVLKPYFSIPKSPYASPPHTHFIRRPGMIKLAFSVGCLLLAITGAAQSVVFRTNHAPLEQAFAWARYKALSLAHADGDPVGPWYEAALPRREAFCMRDVSHQAIGAEILGLGKQNENMFRKFAANINAEKDYCSYWEINRHNKPAPVDYENDKDFWYNLPANFDLIHNAWRLYRWTGNKAYIEDPVFKNFFALSLNEYVDHWDIGAHEVTGRDRALHSAAAKRFGEHRGIPTYNEGGRGPTLLGIDLTASLIAASHAYGEMLTMAGQVKEAELMGEKEERERKFLEEFWYDHTRAEYKSILYADKSFDYFSVGADQAYLHYLLYFGVVEDSTRIRKIMHHYADQQKNLIVELKSYLPILFYEHGQTALANRMIVELCSPSNPRRDYPENAFTVIEHITRGLMGIEPDATTGVISTLSRLEAPVEWVELSNIPALGRRVSVTHNGDVSSSLTNQGTQPVVWQASFYGSYPTIKINGRPKTATVTRRDGREVSMVKVPVPPGATLVADVD